jgi:hypothetical protein
MKLSILIPSRNEQFLKNTVEDILANIEDETEIIVGLDGVWADVPKDPRVSVYYSPISLGGRGMTNQLCRLSKAKYVMKSDAHCAFDKGFDKKLIEDMHDDWTVVPMMYNLHVFDWECKKCGERFYQGPTPPNCKCGNTEFKQVIIWKPRLDRCSWNWVFNKDLKFELGDGCHDTPKERGLVETACLLGACFMLTRKKYWSLNICEEIYGSWAQQWTEVAMKTWSSGGKLMCNQKTWFAHLYRFKVGEFGFPYPQNYDEENEQAKKIIRERFDTEWLLKKFPLKEKKMGCDNWDFYR